MVISEWGEKFRRRGDHDSSADTRMRGCADARMRGHADRGRGSGGGSGRARASARDVTPPGGAAAWRGTQTGKGCGWELSRGGPSKTPAHADRTKAPASCGHPTDLDACSPALHGGEHSLDETRPQRRVGARPCGVAGAADVCAHGCAHLAQQGRAGEAGAVRGTRYPARLNSTHQRGLPRPPLSRAAHAPHQQPPNLSLAALR